MGINKSDSIAALAAALSKAQSEIKGAIKDSTNPFFKSNYADLESVWEACRGALTKNGLSVVQIPVSSEVGIALDTVLMHGSGEWISGTILLNPVKPDPQGVGSAISYYRRYALAAMIGIYQKDDDAEGAMDRSKPQEPSINNVTHVDQRPKPISAVRMATPAQASMIWARLKSELNLEDAQARDFIIHHSGKETSKDLTAEDVKVLVAAIDEECRAGIK